MKRKIIISILGALCLGCTYMATACTNETSEDTGGLTFTQTDAGYVVSGVTQIVAGKVEIPQTYNNKAVVAIDSGAFENQDELQEIVIAENVKTIGARAFASCDQLITIDFGAVEKIENNAFENCSRLKEVTFSQTLVSLGDEVFLGCNKLKELNFPDSVESVGKKVASALESLKKVTIGSGMKTLGESAFLDNDALQEVHISADSALSIGNQAFESCGVLHTVKFGGTVAIGEKAFFKCLQLVEAELGDNCKTIGAYAFSGCTHLTGVTLGVNLATVGERAFGDCHTLIEVCNKSAYPLSVGSSELGNVAKKALNVCTKEADKKRYIGEQGIVYYKDGNELSVVGAVKTESGLHLKFDENTTKIHTYAFYANGSIASVTFGEKVKEVGYKSFGWCTKIKTVTLSNSVTKLETYAFYENHFLDTVIVGTGLASVGENAFYKCKALRQVFYLGDQADFAKITFGASNEPFINATRYFYTETQPTGEGKYWYYASNGGIRIWE